MRLLATIALAGSLVSIANLSAQSLAEHGAAAAGATIGTAAGKPLSGAITKIFGESDDQLKTVNRGTTKASPRTPAPAETPAPAGSPSAAAPVGGAGESGPGASSGSSASATLPSDTATLHRTPARRHKPAEATAVLVPAPAPLTPIAPPVVAEPPAPKQPTAQEIAGIHVGASEQDVLSTLGVPASRVTIPDDDGHLRESLQFWANGTQLGTIRLDNGSVVSVDARRY